MREAFILLDYWYIRGGIPNSQYKYGKDWLYCDTYEHTTSRYSIYWAIFTDSGRMISPQPMECSLVSPAEKLFQKSLLHYSLCDYSPAQFDAGFTTSSRNEEGAIQLYRAFHWGKQACTLQWYETNDVLFPAHGDGIDGSRRWCPFCRFLQEFHFAAGRLPRWLKILHSLNMWIWPQVHPDDKSNFPTVNWAFQVLMPLCTPGHYTIDLHTFHFKPLVVQPDVCLMDAPTFSNAHASLVYCLFELQNLKKLPTRLWKINFYCCFRLGIVGLPL